MIIDSSELPKNTTINSDVCIIGAGAAGLAIAQQLMHSNISVALYEGGGMEYDYKSQELYKGENLGIPYPPLDSVRARYYGGTTNFWAGFVAEFSEREFEPRSWIPNSDWPIRKSDIDPYFEKAFSLCMHGSGEYRWDLQYWLDKLGIDSFPYNGDMFNFHITQIMKRTRPEYRNFGLYLYKEISKSKNVTVYLNSNITELNTNPDGNTITSCDAYTLSGNYFSIKAKHYIVACGGIENARLLLASNSTIKSGIGNSSDMVGRYFCAHPSGVLGKLFIPGKKHPFENIFAKNTTKSGSKFTGEFQLSNKYTEKYNLTNCFIWLRPIEEPYVSDGTRSAWTLKGKLPDHLLYHLGNVINEIDTIANRQYYKYIKETPVNEFEIQLTFESTPVYDSRVTLVNERDRFNKQLAGLDWELSDIDKNTLLKCAELFAKEMGQTGIGRVQIKDDLSSEWPKYLWTVHHHCCTTRMSDDPSTGVVDKNCKVFSMDNLYIAGSSVFSSACIGRPTYLLVALDMRLADHISKRLSL
ncbi:MAG: GMC oxidoreductase [Candidatus Lokiarchaeota archaeon]